MKNYWLDKKEICQWDFKWDFKLELEKTVREKYESKYIKIIEITTLRKTFEPYGDKK